MKKTEICDLIFLDTFHDGESLNPSRSVRLSKNKLNFGSENKKLSNKLLVLEC